MNKTLRTFLESQGFKEYNSPHSDPTETFFQKRIDQDFDNPTLCSTNDKLYIHVTYFSFDIPDKQATEPFATQLHEGVTVALRHGAVDDNWFDIRMYALKPEQFNEEFLEQSIWRLVSAWEAVNKLDK